MKHTNIGQSGLRVGRLAVGTLTWGRDTDLDDAAAITSSLLAAGGNLIDISPAYGEGLAVETLGKILRKSVSRSDLVIAAHTGFSCTEGTEHTDFRAEVHAGRNTVIANTEHTLSVLGTHYLDLLVLGAPDPSTPLGETLSAAENLLRRGLVRYLAIANYPAWKAALALQRVADDGEKIIALGTQLSLLNRQRAEQLLQLAEFTHTSVIAYAPLAGGALTGKYRNTIPPTSRAATPHLAYTVSPFLPERPRRITEAVAKAADGLGRTPSDIALSWLLSDQNVAAAVCGPRTANQANRLFAAETEDLPEQVLKVLNDIS